MYLRDNCDNCDASADVGIEDDNVRLSLRVWECKFCGHLNVTAFDWERGEMTSAEVFDARSTEEQYENLKRTMRRKQRERRR